MPIPDWIEYQPVQVFSGGKFRVRSTEFRERVPLSPTFSFNHDLARSTQDFYIPWDGDAGAIAQARYDLLGATTITKYADGSKSLSRIVPYSHPNFPNELYAIEIPKVEGDIALESEEGSQDDDGVAAYDEAKLTVTFSSLPYAVLDDFTFSGGANFPTAALLPEWNWTRYVAVHMDPTGYTQSIPAGNALRWLSQAAGGPGGFLENGYKLPICMADVTVTWYQIPLPAIPITAIKQAIGKINLLSMGVASPNNPYSFPVETLLCLTPKITPYYRMGDGNFAADIIYRFKYTPYFTHNHFYNWQTASFIKATRTGLADNTGFFQRFDFTALFQPEP